MSELSNIKLDRFPMSSRDLETVLQVLQAATEELQRKYPPTEIAYRLIGGTRASDFDAPLCRECIRDVGILSRGRDAYPTWDREVFRQHCAGLIMDPPSPYISISTSPKRILNLYPKDVIGLDVALIDLRLLRKLNRHCERTTDLAERFDLSVGKYEDGRVPFVTDSHLLVREHIPQACLLGFIPAMTFQVICTQNYIDEQYDADCRKTLAWEVLKPCKSDTSAFVHNSALDFSSSSSQSTSRGPEWLRILDSSRRNRHQESRTRTVLQPRHSSPSSRPFKVSSHEHTSTSPSRQHHHHHPQIKRQFRAVEVHLADRPSRPQRKQNYQRRPLQTADSLGLDSREPPRGKPYTFPDVALPKPAPSTFGLYRNPVNLAVSDASGHVQKSVQPIARNVGGPPSQVHSLPWATPAVWQTVPKPVSRLPAPPAIQVSAFPPNSVLGASVRLAPQTTPAAVNAYQTMSISDPPTMNLPTAPAGFASYSSLWQSVPAPPHGTNTKKEQGPGNRSNPIDL